MKAIKFFLIGLITVGFVACNNEDDINIPGHEINNGTTKVVTLKVDGFDTETRGIQNSTPGSNDGSYNVTISEFMVIFHDNDSVLKVQDVNTKASMDSLKNKGVIFHNVPAKASRVMVIANGANKGIKWDSKKIETIKKLPIYASSQQNRDDITFYGDSILNKTNGQQHTDSTHANTTLTTYSAVVKIKPLVSRFEITGIECTDLGDSIESIKLTGIGLLDFIQEVNLNSTTIPNKYYLSGSADGTKGNIFEPGGVTPSTNPSFIFGKFGGKSDSIKWSFDAITPTYKLTESNNRYTPGTNKVFAYNFIVNSQLKNLPNIKLALDSVVTKNNYIIPGDWKYVTTKSSEFEFSDGKQLVIEPGYIYKLDFAFEEANVGPYDPENKKCIRLTVQVDPWKIKLLTPSFH